MYLTWHNRCACSQCKYKGYLGPGATSMCFKAHLVFVVSFSLHNSWRRRPDQMIPILQIKTLQLQEVTEVWVPLRNVWPCHSESETRSLHCREWPDTFGGKLSLGPAQYPWSWGAQQPASVTVGVWLSSWLTVCLWSWRRSGAPRPASQGRVFPRGKRRHYHASGLYNISAHFPAWLPSCSPAGFPGCPVRRGSPSLLDTQFSKGEVVQPWEDGGLGVDL